jgi:CubicO group peptidase (beta-lactamase class C family)
MRVTTGAIFVCLTLVARPAPARELSDPKGSIEAQQSPERVRDSSVARHAVVAGAGSPAEAVDDVVRSEMKKRQIPGLSLAIVEEGRIVKATGYGVTEKGGSQPVTSSTLFQAGSISKPVAALGALRLVEEGKFTLDEDVNGKLSSWKVPENQFTREKKVTARGLLSHTAGLTVHGFGGYATDEPVPTLEQVLNGVKPANSAPIRVDIAPGSQWRYSGGGYTVMQQMILDLTGKPYPLFMKAAVLGPLNMSASTFEQPLPADKAEPTASGHHSDRSPVKGRWHIYPEMAAAGLWTTPSDLARFAIGVQEALSGKSDKTLSPSMARQMITEERNSYGLGVGLEGSEKARRFQHGGRDEGFDAILVAYVESGQGAVVMINTNDNSRMMQRIVEAIAREYRWAGHPSVKDRTRSVAQVSRDKLVACTGRYEIANNQMLTLKADGGHLVSIADGFPDEEFVPEADDRYFSPGRNVQVTFLKDESGKVSGCLWNEDGKGRKAPRIGPLFQFLTPRPDPDAARTEKVVGALKAIEQGGKALADSPLLTPGARSDFGLGPVQGLSGNRSVSFVMEEDVSERRIERHKGAVDRILYYWLMTDHSKRGLLIHMTADGLITDYDIVED